MGLLDKLKELNSEQYGHMFFLEGSEFEKATSAMLGNVPEATSSNAHNREMEMFLYKLFGKYMSKNGPGSPKYGAVYDDLLMEFYDKGYPLAQELKLSSLTDASRMVGYSETLLENPFATEEQKENAKKVRERGFNQFRRNFREIDSKATSNEALYDELIEIRPSEAVPRLDPKHLSSEQGQQLNKVIAPFLGRLYNKVDY